MKFSKILAAFLYPAILFALNQWVFSPIGMYDRFPWFDIPMHFSGGIAVGITGVLLLKGLKNDGLIKAHWLVEAALIVGFVSSIAIAWEWYEFLLAHFFNIVTQPSSFDTVKDLFFGVLGGCFAVIIRKCFSR